MKRMAVVALMVIGLALPVCAQRSGFHGGFSGRSSAAFHGGGFRGATPGRFGGYSHFAGGGFTGAARGSQRGYGGNFNSRAAYAGRDHEHGRYRRPYRSNYGAGYPYYGAVYPYVYPGFIDGFTLDNPDTFDDDDSSQAATSNESGEYQAQPSDAYQPPDYGPYQPPPYPSAPYPPATYPYQSAPSQPYANQSQPPSPPESQNAVTLVFKDGRPPEKIHNYLLTRTTLYVGGKHQRDIPIDQLDVDATVKVNREAGVDFSLPTTPGS